MKNSKLLTVVLVLQALVLVGQWAGAPSLVSPAHAQVPDAGAQRIEILKEVRELNAKVDRLIGFLESGKLEVKVAQADDNKGGRR